MLSIAVIYSHSCLITCFSFLFGTKAAISRVRGCCCLCHLHFSLQISPLTADSHRNNTLPRAYELMMQKIMHRVGPTKIGQKRLNRISMDLRKRKCSEEARLSTPEGRVIMHRQLIKGKSSLYTYDWWLLIDGSLIEHWYRYPLCLCPKRCLCTLLLCFL